MYLFIPLRFFLIAVLATFTGTLCSQTISRDDIVGVWLSENEKAQIRIEKKAKGYYGKVVWLKDPLNENGLQKSDKLNPDPALRSRPLMELEVIKDLVFEKNHWVDGSAYDPENGKIYSLTVWLKDKKLELRGYSGSSMIGRIQTWTRVDTAGL